MARPVKLTVDYFPHIINKGKTIFILEENYGNDGYAFWFKILELLGATKNHYYNCNNPQDWKFLLAKTRVNEDIANNILNLLSELNAIDQELWDKKIIFSENFIANIQDVYKRRGVNVITKSDVTSLCNQKLTISDVSNNRKRQIKLNKTKLNKTKVNKNKVKESILDSEKPTVKKTKISNPDIRIFLLSFCEKFINVTGQKYPINWGKDGNIIKGLLQTYSLDELTALRDLFFMSQDKFILDAGYSIGIFSSVIHKLISGGRSSKLGDKGFKTSEIDDWGKK